MSKHPLSNIDEITPTERRILIAIRQLRLFDKLEIKFSEKNQLQWQLTRSERGVYNMLDADNEKII